MPYLRILLSFAAALTVFCSSSMPVRGAADTYPSKPVMVVVPYAAGGPTDVEGRLYSAKMSGVTGQQFVLDFKPGAGTMVGSDYVAKAAPDGYTLLVVTASFASFPALYQKLPFDILKDFAPVSLMSQRTSVLVVRPSFPAKTMAEYVAYAKANPGKINFGTAGVGSITHLAGAWMHGATNSKATYVHYKGAAAQIQDVLAQRLDAIMTIISSVLPQIKAGKLRALAITNNRRSKLLPDLPTIAEQGIAGFNYANWLGLVAPGATPSTIVNKLSEALARIAKAPDVAGPFEAGGTVMVGSTPAQFKQVIITEAALWRKVVKEAGIKLNE